MEGHTVHVEQKVWGMTRRVHENRETGWWVDHATIHPGGFSSIHKHPNSVNKFQVVQGFLEIRVFGNGDAPSARETQIFYVRQGQAHEVPAGYWHQFFARSAVQLIEVYWRSPGASADYEIPDITRATTGGRDGPTRPIPPASRCCSGGCRTRTRSAPRQDGGGEREAVPSDAGADGQEERADGREGVVG